MNILYDVAIIGGGPCGLTAAQYAARSKLKTIILDKSPTAGALAFTPGIENYPGLRSITGKELLNIFRSQAIQFGAEYVEIPVIGLSLSNDIKEIYTMDKIYQAKTVIIATGAMGRTATIKGEAKFLGKGVSYCAICDATFFKDKIVCVFGKGEEAVKEADILSRFAKIVYLISPTKDLKTDETHLTLANIKLLKGYTITSIEGDETVEAVKIKDTNGNEERLEVSGVFIYLLGNKPRVDFLRGAIDISEDGRIIVNEFMETNIDGVFAAGDVVSKIKQVVVASAQGCIAALSSEKYLFKRKNIKLDWH